MYDKSKILRLVKSSSLVFSIILLCLCLCACFGVEQPKQVAAIVYGNSIYEEDVSNYISQWRNMDEHRKTDEGFIKEITSLGFTPASFREYILNTVFIPEKIVNYNCKQLNLSISQEELNSQIDKAKTSFDTQNSQTTFDLALKNLGYTDDSWQDNIEFNLKREKLKRALFSDYDFDDSLLKEYIIEHAPDCNGKYSYYVNFDTMDEAKQAHDEFVTVHSGDISLDDFKSLGAVIDIGWSSFKNNKEKLDTAYFDALTGIPPLRISEPLDLAKKIYIIYCEQEFIIEKFETSSKFEYQKQIDEQAYINKIPQDIYDYLELNAKSEQIDSEFNIWLQDQNNEDNVKINKMPSDANYNIDL
ncbi:MAG: SurA N-terminal domain-containing protein [Coriobacteriales bacterium]|nr:SurA N-terminal domain-containing protein [Coriobacteriales bacterium]